jgi:2-dehydropantoate 2-reductase
MFTRAGIPCRINENIIGELWTKLIWNCTLNAISALGQVRYGEIAANEDARRVVRSLAEEVVAVAHAAGIRLEGIDEADAAFAGACKIATQMSGALSSTAQDMLRGKRTEIDSLNGYISRRGAELGMPTPVNHALFTMVKLLESSALK